MSAKNDVLQVVSGWDTVELVLKCLFLGMWQILKILVKNLWKGHRRKLSKNFPPVEMSVDASVGTHCHIKIMGVKYHYVETGPKSGQMILILCDAPETTDLWAPNWSSMVQTLTDHGYHIITLDLRGTGGSEGGSRRELSPPRAVEELSNLMEALGASPKKPAIVIGFGIGGMLTWYLAHCYGPMVSKFAVIEAPHPNLYWEFPPAKFCREALHFIQWPYFPEQWLAEGELCEGENGRWLNSRARDWRGPLNYIRGAAWWRISSEARVDAAALLVGEQHSAAMLVRSAAHCTRPALRLLPHLHPALPGLLLEFLIEKDTIKSNPEEVPKSLMGRVLGAVAERARLVLPPHAVHLSAVNS